MDGREVNQRAQTAREMTDEINRVTDAGVLGAENQVDRGQNVGALSSERARGIGNLAVGQAQAYGPEMERVQGRDAGKMLGVAGENLRQLEHVPERMMFQDELVRERAELEDGYARNEIRPNLSSVGLESGIQQAERRAADMANGMAEVAPVSFEDKLQNKTQEELGRVVAMEMGNLQRQKSFIPNDVVELRDKWMIKMMGTFQNPRVFKGGNE